MRSIRARLLVWLVSAVTLGALFGAAVTYRSVLNELESQFDYQLRQMALSLRDQGFVSADDAAAFADERMDFVVQIWTMDGKRIYASQAPFRFPARAVLGFTNIESDGQAWRIFSVAARDRVIQVGQPIEVRRELAAQAALRSVIPTLAVAPLIAVLIWWSVGASLAPLRRIAAEVKRRDVGTLGPIAVAEPPAEVVPLTQAINSLLERLRASFAAQRNFVADAAHELRSPLTALRLQLGLLSRAPTPAAQTEALEALSNGIDRATRLVEQLLTLARNEHGAVEEHPESVEIGETTRLAVSDVVAMADARRIEISLEARQPFRIMGNATALRILVRNLVDNAVRYTPEGSRVTIATGADNGRAVLLIDDSGEGIPAAERDRVFDRFYRRSNGGDTSTGSGLGLAIVRTIAEQHGADVILETSPLGGLRVRVVFPCAGTASGQALSVAANSDGRSG